MTERPISCPPMWEHIPEELRQRPQWVCWNYVWREEKWTKVPICAQTGRNASATDPSSWGTFDQAVRKHDECGYDGIGYVFSEDDPYTGIDLDKCIDPQGVIDPAFAELVSQFASYSEISPSGTGIKIWIKGDVQPSLGKDYKGEPKRGSKQGQYEAYSAKRFFTVTGRMLPGTNDIRSAQDELNTFINAHLLAKEKRKHAKPEHTHPSIKGKLNTLSDDDLRWKAMSASVSGPAIKSLMDGDISAYDGDDSRADSALLSHLAFWFGPDPGVIEAAFNRSKLAERAKWREREDYRQASIHFALQDRTEFYTPSKHIKVAGKETPERQPAEQLPFNKSAEQSVLGTLLQDVDAIDRVRKQLCSEDFYVAAYRRLFEEIGSFIDEGNHQTIDLVTFGEWLCRHDGGQPIMSESQLAELVSRAHPEQLEKHAQIVKGCADRRLMIQEAKWIIQEASRSSQTQTLLDEFEARVLAIRDRHQTDSMISLGKATHLVLDRIEAVNNGKCVGLQTGLPDLDVITQLRAQELIVCAARTSVGKSILGGQIGIANARMGKRVYLSSVEMSREDIAGRMMSCAFSVDAAVTGARRPVSLEEMKQAIEASDKLYKHPLWINDSSTQSVPLIAAEARRIKREHGLDLIIVDYMQLLQCKKLRTQTRAESLGEVARGLKRIAKELNVPVLALAQLNRETERSQEPELHHIRESGDIEQDADQVWLLWRDAEFESHIHLKVAKNRNGQVARLLLVHDKKYMRFAAYQPVVFGRKAGSHDEV